MEGKKVLCLYSRFGCRQHVAIQDLEDHEMTCRCKPSSCPVEGCQWSGRLLKLSTHLKELHNFLSYNSFEVNIDVNMQQYAPYIYLINKCMRKYFIIIIETQRAREAKGEYKTFHVYVMILSSKEVSQSYGFRLMHEISNLRFSWEGIPISIEEYDVCNPSLVLHELSVRPFIRENNNFRLTVGVYKL